MKRIGTMIVVFMVFALICSMCIGCTDKKCEHSFSDWTTTQEPTCTEKGHKERVCSKCGEKEEKDINAVGHNFVDGVCTDCGARE